MTATTIFLDKTYFSPLPKTLLLSGELKAVIFQYPSGVHGLRLENARGSLVVLPFQGQQIWSAEFDGRELTMKSMFTQPKPTQTYLENYGGFLLHCGATAMGVPGEGDSHPLHGELPNAPYDNAYLTIGEDDEGCFLGVGGSYQHTVAFAHNYVSKPLLKLYEGSAVIDISLQITNLMQTEMELMYMTHINFKPVDNAELVYSAFKSPETVRVRTSIPSHIQPPPGYRAFLQQLVEDPSMHHSLKPGLAFDPEVVFSIDYLAGQEGWAHSLQVHPDGASDYVAHRPDELDKGVRWISRTKDQDALGIVLPATAEPEGYTAEKAKGNIKRLGAEESFSAHMRAGALTSSETKDMVGKIESVLQNSRNL